MKFLAAAIASLAMIASSSAQADQTKSTSRSNALPMLTLEDVRTVAPALEKYTQGPLLGDLWKRPGLGPRDRSIVTLAALIARNQTIEMAYHVNLALDNGVKPREISEIVTHLAFYAGWANAMSAVAMAKDVFAERGIDDGQLAPNLGDLFLITDEIGIDEVVESPRLLRNLWRRPDLSPRDRKLVTISALIALGKATPIPDHLMRVMDDGLRESDIQKAADPRS